jgi:NAD(P)-dependent dehydrogenase (short-subunit alcohol dehydrogenase family)
MTSRAVLITGGSSGIGRALVRRFAADGHQVWFTYRSGLARAEELVAELDGTTDEVVRAFPLDQGDWSSHEDLRAQLPRHPDVLVNNAAVGSKTVERYRPGSTPEQESAFFQVNCVGPLWLAQAFLASMERNGYGKIVNVASVAGGVSPLPTARADGMSKAALAYLTRHLAAELVHSPVDVFAVCPGAVDTPMLGASVLDDLGPDGRTAFMARLPKGRLIRAEEIADVVAWLCSPGAAAFHGAVVDASMGLGVRPGLLTELDVAVESGA